MGIFTTSYNSHTAVAYHEQSIGIELGQNGSGCRVVVVVPERKEKNDIDCRDRGCQSVNKALVMRVQNYFH